MMPGDIRTWVPSMAYSDDWNIQYAGKLFMLLEEHHSAISVTWDVLTEGRRAVYSEDMIRTNSMPLRGDSERQA